MKLFTYWKRFLFVEIILIFISFFFVNLLVDFMTFSAEPITNTPAPYFPYVFEDNAPTLDGFVEKYWTQLLFFLLVFFGQIAIFRLRKNIFIIKPRKNG